MSRNEFGMGKIRKVSSIIAQLCMSRVICIVRCAVYEIQELQYLLWWRTSEIKISYRGIHSNG